MNTEQGNKLIAEFMGVKWQPARKVWLFPSGSTVGDINGYHTSWDWLMPVVEKVNNTQIIKGYAIEITNLKEQVIDALMLIDMNKIWESAVKFITYYNQLSTNK